MDLSKRTLHWRPNCAVLTDVSLLRSGYKLYKRGYTNYLKLNNKAIYSLYADIFNNIVEFCLDEKHIYFTLLDRKTRDTYMTFEIETDTILASELQGCIEVQESWRFYNIKRGTSFTTSVRCLTHRLGTVTLIDELNIAKTYDFCIVGFNYGLDTKKFIYGRINMDSIIAKLLIILNKTTRVVLCSKPKQPQVTYNFSIPVSKQLNIKYIIYNIYQSYNYFIKSYNIISQLINSFSNYIFKNIIGFLYSSQHLTQLIHNISNIILNCVDLILKALNVTPTRVSRAVILIVLLILILLILSIIITSILYIIL